MRLGCGREAPGRVMSTPRTRIRPGRSSAFAASRDRAIVGLHTLTFRPVVGLDSQAASSSLPRRRASDGAVEKAHGPVPGARVRRDQDQRSDAAHDESRLPCRLPAAHRFRAGAGVVRRAGRSRCASSGAKPNAGSTTSPPENASEELGVARLYCPGGRSRWRPRVRGARPAAAAARGPTVEAARGAPRLRPRAPRRRAGRSARASSRPRPTSAPTIRPPTPTRRPHAAHRAALWAPPGTVYVYLIYGMHHCLNLAVDRHGFPGCVLVRAAEPLGGSGLARRRLPRSRPAVPRARDRHAACPGRHLFEPDAGPHAARGEPPPRVGRPAGRDPPAAERPLRFYDADSRAVSAPRPAGVSFAAVPRRSTRPATEHAARRRSR